MTRDQLIEMSEAMDSGFTTQRKAAEALAAVARTGDIAGANFGAVAQAAIAMERMSGQAIDKTVSEFAKLGTDPVNTLAKLNQEHHFLTDAVYEQVRALEEQGRHQDAARVATERDIARAGGVNIVEAMRQGFRGYAAGGVVGAGSAASLLQPVINVSIEKGADRDSVEQTRSPGGGINLKIMVRDAMRTNIADGSLDAVAGSVWGVRRRGTPSG